MFLLSVVIWWYRTIAHCYSENIYSDCILRTSTQLFSDLYLISLGQRAIDLPAKRSVTSSSHSRFHRKTKVNKTNFYKSSWKDSLFIHQHLNRNINTQIGFSRKLINKSSFLNRWKWKSLTKLSIEYATSFCLFIYSILLNGQKVLKVQFIVKTFSSFWQT